MSAFYENTISITGIEKDFMSALISALTGISYAVTCTGDISQYEGATSVTPEFIININGKPTITLTRSAALSSNGYINIKVNVGTNLIVTSKKINFWSNTADPNSPINRKANISWIASTNGNVIFINIREGFSGGSRYYGNYAVSTFKINNNVYGDGFYFSKQDNPISKDILFDMSKYPSGNKYNPYVYKNYDNANDNGSFVSRFQYTTKPGIIDYVKSSIYVDSGTKKLECPSLFDCSTVNSGDTMSLKDGAYLAVGTHQLVKVS